MKSIYSKEYREVLLKLGKARKKAGLTQAHMAKLLNKPQSFISKVESGERRLDIVEMWHIAKLYKVNVKDLL